MTILNRNSEQNVLYPKKTLYFLFFMQKLHGSINYFEHSITYHKYKVIAFSYSPPNKMDKNATYIVKMVAM